MKKLIAAFISLFAFSVNAAVISLDFSGSFSDYGNQFENGQVEATNGGANLTMNGNNWVAFEGPFVIEQDTILEVTFFSSLLGELHGFGFDNDVIFDSQDDYRDGANRYFQLGGTQTFGVQDFNTYQTENTIETFFINVGSFVTGTFNYIVFINDQDVEGVDANSVYSISASNSNFTSVSEPGILSILLSSLVILFASRRLKG
ncbi:hypothetical protein [Alteromonas mediterranea]|uniref:hypothetical protein n=1 Tax=Alteromonas mediterranea TaxID=314275 RepID=UPI002FE07F81